MWPLKGKKKVALVLSGGSARGLAHIGVLKVLKREGFMFDLVVGSSIGSLIGAAYCLDIPIDELEKSALQINTADIIDITISRMGLTEGRKLENVIRRTLQEKKFEEMKVAFAVTAVNIESGEDIYFTGGDLIKTVKASCSLPGIYKPVEYDGRLLSDGGLKQHLPVEIARKLGADYVVGVDVGFCVKKGKINNMLGVIMQSIQILGQELSTYQSGKADIIIKPDLGGDVDQLAFNKSAYIIQKGEEAANEALYLLRKHVRTG